MTPGSIPYADTAGRLLLKKNGLLRKAAPKPREQIISELAPKITRPGITPGRAMITAEQTYAEAERRFGANAPTVLEILQPGQDPRRFLDGFQNAYILGKQGAGPTALNNSSAAAYLTDSQRAYAYTLGERAIEIKGHSGIIKRNNVDVRTWYIDKVSQIPNLIDANAPIEQRARQAFELRNQIRTEARAMMADVELRKQLDQIHPNITFEELVESKMRRKGMTKEEAILDIYTTATKTNEKVNNELGLGGN